MPRGAAWGMRGALGALWLLGLGPACPECVPGSGHLDFNCQGNGDCALGYVCQDGLCVRDSAAVDAGHSPLDAAAPDRQAQDQTPLDRATQDAAAPDTLAEDASTDDAASDAASPDAATCSLDAGASPWTLDPVMTRRQTQGPFGVAPLIQGPVSQDLCAAGDAIAVARGDYLGASFHAHFDPTQGSLVAWVTPEWDIDDVVDDSRTVLAAGDFVFGVDGALRGAFAQLGGARLSFPDALAGWTAGSTHLLVLRWDHRHLIDGGEVSLIVDDATPLTASASITLSHVSQDLVIGAADLDGRGALGALLEGLTIYRRPLTGAGGGVNVGRDDEVAAIWAAGGGTEPTLITGSWDVVLALPGDAEEGPLPAQHQAFSHPHTQNLLGRDGLMLSQEAHRNWTPTAASPSIVHTESTGPADWIYKGALRVTTYEAAQGLSHPIDVSGLESIVVRAVTHSVGETAALLRVVDDTDTILAELSGTPTSTRERPDVLLLTATVPAGPTPTILHVQVRNRAAAGTAFVLHQVEVLPNLLRNPSFETGGGAPWVPEGWTNEYPATTTTWQETQYAHSGVSSLGLEPAQSSQDFHQIIQSPSALTGLGHFYMTGAQFWWEFGTAPLISVENGCFFRLAAPVSSSAKFDVSGSAVSGTWQHLAGVGRRHRTSTDDGNNCWNNILRYGGTWRSAAKMLIDDAYVVHLDQVAIQPLPADLGRSLEAGLVRADGEDAMSMPIDTLTATSGRIELTVGLDHPVALYPAFCPYDGVLWQAFGDADNHITLRFNYDTLDGRHGIRVDATFGGQHYDYTVLGLDLDGRAAHAIALRYQTGGRIQLFVDGVRQLDDDLGARQFSTVPHTLYAGGNAGGWDHCDLRVDVDGALFSVP